MAKQIIDDKVMENVEILAKLALTEEERKKAKEKMQEILERAFDFAGRAFGDGQESAMFVERLSMDERILKFIQKNGCSAYQKAGACIQAEEREEELQNEIQKLTNFLQK